jgi:cation diffusion facilitator CzcD-associated flavoprotein CzcO
VIEAQRIVAATGPFQRPVIPAIAPQSPAIQQLHSAHYFNPQQLPEGGVLVIGAGSSGVQIADELQRAGRAVWLSVGRTTARRVAIASAIFAGGSGCWECGMPRPMRRVKSMSLSR